MDVDLQTRARIESLAGQHPGLELFVLYGSRARGEAHAGSDWDFGFLGSNVDVLALQADLVAAVGTDDVDVVDLARCSALLAFHAARDGVLVFQRRPEAFEEFQIHATSRWLDMEPVVRAAHREVLAGLGP